MRLEIDVLELVKHSAMLVTAYLVAPLHSVNFLFTFMIMAAAARGVLALHEWEMQNGHRVFKNGMRVVRFEIFDRPRIEVIQDMTTQMFWVTVPYALLTLVFSVIPECQHYVMVMLLPVWFCALVWFAAYAFQYTNSEQPQQHDCEDEGV